MDVAYHDVLLTSVACEQDFLNMDTC